MNVSKTHISPSSQLITQHHLNWRLKGLEFIRNIKKPELCFTAPLSVSHKDFELIKIKLLNLIDEISQIVAKSEPEMVACLNIDQFIVASKNTIKN